MNALLPVGPDDVQARLDRAEAGQTIVLGPGRYREPLRLVGRAGEPGRPIVIRGQPGAVLDGETSLLLFNHRAQLVAKADWLLGRRPPGIQAIALEAFVSIDCCDHVRLEDLAISGAWPTAVLIDNSTDVTARRLDIRDGTFAFFLHGERTRRVVIEDCAWLQDTSGGDLWRRIAWARVHGDDWQEADARGLDGDFLRSYRIAGDLTVRRNRIAHAFNGIHCFNRKPDLPASLNRNVYVYENEFSYIRDNPIEPEGAAWNWWIFHNRFFNCHKWFSLELERSGWLYIFGNRGWFDEVPGPPNSKNQGGAVFKFPDARKPGYGPHYVFNNSWYLRSPLAEYGRFADFEHVNNAILYCALDPAAGSACTRDATLLGDIHGASEAVRFTNAWKELNIRFANDRIAHPDFPAGITAAGYPLESGGGDDPAFRDPAAGDFRLREASPCRGQAIPVRLDLGQGRVAELTPQDIGALQGESLIRPPEGVIPDYASCRDQAAG